MQVAPLGGVSARPLIPRTPALVEVLEHVQVPSLGGDRARVAIAPQAPAPLTPVHVLEDVQMAALHTNAAARLQIPRAPVLASPLQHVHVASLGCQPARLLIPRTPLLVRPLNDGEVPNTSRPTHDGIDRPALRALREAPLAVRSAQPLRHAAVVLREEGEPEDIIREVDLAIDPQALQRLKEPVGGEEQDDKSVSRSVAGARTRTRTRIASHALVRLTFPWRARPPCRRRLPTPMPPSSSRVASVNGSRASRRRDGMSCNAPKGTTRARALCWWRTRTRGPTLASEGGLKLHKPKTDGEGRPCTRQRPHFAMPSSITGAEQSRRDATLASIDW